MNNDNNINESVNKQYDVIICDDCGQVIIDKDMAYTTDDGRTICESCYKNNYFTCERCGEIHYITDSIFISDNEEYVCLECADKYYYKCMDCGEYFSIDNIYIDRWGDILCHSCYESDYIECHNCGCFVPLWEAYNYGEDMYCEDCYRELIPDCVYGYHSFDNWNILSTPNEILSNDMELIGLEIEVDSDCCIEKDVIEESHERLNGDGVYMSDGSLDNGFEIVTHPMTKEYIYKNFKENITNVMEILKNNDVEGYNKGGIHIHVSDNMISSELSTVLKGLLNKQYKDFWITLTQRNETKLNQWAELYPINKTTRYQALNYDSRTNTFEFRIFNSSTRVDRIFKNIEVVYSLIDFAKSKNASTNIEDYIAYIMNNRYKYNYLFNFMIKKELIKMEDLLQCA